MNNIVIVILTVGCSSAHNFGDRDGIDMEYLVQIQIKFEVI